MPKKKKEVIIDNVDIYKLEHTKLLKFAEALHKKLEAERRNRALLQVDRDEINVSWAITKDQLTKLAFDVTATQQAAEKNALAISELETRLREQRTSYVYENDHNLDRARLENEKVTKELATECKKQTNELFLLNSLLQKAVEDRDAQHRNKVKNVQLEYVRLVHAKTEQLEGQMAQVFDKMEEQFTNLGLAVETKHVLELQRHQYIHDKNVKLTIDNYTEEIEKIRMYYNDQCSKQLTLIKQLKDKLQTAIDKNQYLNKQVSDLKKENKKLDDDYRENIARCQYMERRVLNYDRCVKSADASNKELKKYKKLLELKSLENEILEADNAAMKQGFEKYDDYFVDVVLDMNAKMTNQSIIARQPTFQYKQQ